MNKFTQQQVKAPLLAKSHNGRSRFASTCGIGHSPSCPVFRAPQGFFQRSRWKLLHVPLLLKDNSAFAFLLMPGVLRLTAWCSSRYLQCISLPVRSLYASVGSLTNCMPVLIHERIPPSAVSHLRGIDEVAQHTLVFTSQWSSSSAPSRTTASRKSAVKLGFTTGRDSCVSPNLQTEPLPDCPS